MYDDAVTESYHTIRRLPRPGFKVERLEPVGGQKYPLFSNAADLLPPIEVGMDNAVTPDQHTYFRIDDRFHGIQVEQRIFTVAAPQQCGSSQHRYYSVHVHHKLNIAPTVILNELKLKR